MNGFRGNFSSPLVIGEKLSNPCRLVRFSSPLAPLIFVPCSRIDKWTLCAVPKSPRTRFPGNHSRGIKRVVVFDLTKSRRYSSSSSLFFIDNSLKHVRATFTRFVNRNASFRRQSLSVGVRSSRCKQAPKRRGEERTERKERGGERFKIRREPSAILFFTATGRNKFCKMEFSMALHDFVIPIFFFFFFFFF